MKLALFTPCNVKSSIGRDSLHIERELLRLGHDVTIVRTEDASFIAADAHPYQSAIFRWDESEQIASLRTSVDMVVYQIGDNPVFHHGALVWLPQWPGVICLHDYYLGDLFWAWANGRREVATAVLRQWYGDDVATTYFSATSSDQLIERTYSTAPLTEWIAAQALGVLTHSSWNIKRVLNACSGPVYVAGVPTGTLHLEESPVYTSGEQGQSLQGKAARSGFRVLTVGHANPNKRSESIIQAIGQSKQVRSSTSYHLVGHIETVRAKHLNELASRLGVKLVIRGEVDNATLAAEIADADVLCCLRYPALEAASGSAIEAMLSGKAIVVTDAGFYSEIPDDCVRKVQVSREVESLSEALEFLFDHPDERIAMGARARTWAEQAFNPENYVKKLLEVCRAASAAQAHIPASQFFAEALIRWGATSDQLRASGALPWLDVSLPLLATPSNRDD